MTICQRCRDQRATLEVSFRSGLGYTDSVYACQSCANIIVPIAKRAARIIALDLRPEWQRRDLAKDMTRRDVA